MKYLIASLFLLAVNAFGQLTTKQMIEGQTPVSSGVLNLTNDRLLFWDADASAGNRVKNISPLTLRLDMGLTPWAGLTPGALATLSTVGSATITDGAILDADIGGSAAIALSKLATNPLARANHTGTQLLATISDAGGLASLGAVGSSTITDGSIVNSDISASAAIALSKLAVDPLARANHTGTQLLATISDAGSLAGLSSVGAAQITDGSILDADVGDAALTAAKVAPSQFNFYDARNYALTSFVVNKSVTTVASTSTGISGATYNAATGTVFLIRNVSGAAGTIYEVNEEGTVLRTITNSNFIDTESIEWIAYDSTVSADIFLVGEEDHTTAATEGRLTLCRLTRGATTLDRTTAGNVSATTAYSGGTMGNLCIEAVAYDPRRGSIYYTSEKQTTIGSDNTPGTAAAKIFTRTITAIGTMAFGTESILCSVNTLFSGGTLTDISDMTYDPNTDTILMVSDESDKVVRVNRSGTLLEQVATPGAQPEGLALHPNGTRMFVVGEPQEFYRYEIPWGMQVSDGDLNALAAMDSTAGFFAKTAANTYAARTITANSSKIAITNGAGTAGNPLIDVTEANLTLNNIGGTLSVAKGGTGTATPGIVAGTNVTVSGTWPNQTINSTGGGGGGTTLTPTDLAGGTTLAVNTWYHDTLSLNRTMDDVDLIGVDGDQILWTFDVTGATRSVNFHTNSSVYRVGEVNALTSVVNFPVGNHHLKLHKIDSKWWLTDSGIITEAARAFSFALSDETSAITIGTKLTWRAPFACTITAVYAELTTTSSGAAPQFDINNNGSTILSTKLTVDASETDSATAATPAVISNASLAARDRLTFDIDTAGTGAVGAKITIVYTQP